MFLLKVHARLALLRGTLEQLVAQAVMLSHSHAPKDASLRVPEAGGSPEVTRSRTFLLFSCRLARSVGNMFCNNNLAALMANVKFQYI